MPDAQPAHRLISIHAPREGCDNLSTKIFETVVSISIHAPREGCDFYHLLFEIRSISIHAPREGCDVGRIILSPISLLFQSTHPVRGATYAIAQVLGVTVISIHAPREGCDAPAVYVTFPFCRISIHAPREGCDRRRILINCSGKISIHAPREGCDCHFDNPHGHAVEFQSTHPVRGATMPHGRPLLTCWNFNPRTP